MVKCDSGLVFGRAARPLIVLTLGFKHFDVMQGCRRAVHGEIVQNGAVGVVVAPAGLDHTFQRVFHLCDFTHFFFQLIQVALGHGFDFAAGARVITPQAYLL